MTEDISEVLSANIVMYELLRESIVKTEYIRILSKEQLAEKCNCQIAYVKHIGNYKELVHEAMSKNIVLWSLSEKQFRNIIVCNLKPCPVCGKAPKVRIIPSAISAGLGGDVTIHCTPFLRKPHVKITKSAAVDIDALTYAAKKWNSYWNQEQ